MEEKWGDGQPAGNNGHDVTEVAPGLVLTSTNPMMFLDARKDPRHPKLLATSRAGCRFVHSNLWPRNGKDKFALSTGETWVAVARMLVATTPAPGSRTWDTTGWKKTQTFKEVDTYQDAERHVTRTATRSSTLRSVARRTGSTRTRSGRTVASLPAGFYNHGTRFLEVDAKGKISEVGCFLPHGGGTSAAYWITNDIVYAIDYQRGFDVLKYNGKV